MYLTLKVRPHVSTETLNISRPVTFAVHIHFVCLYQLYEAGSLSSQHEWCLRWVGREAMMVTTHANSQGYCSGTNLKISRSDSGLITCWLRFRGFSHAMQNSRRADSKVHKSHSQIESSVVQTATLSVTCASDWTEICEYNIRRTSCSPYYVIVSKIHNYQRATYSLCVLPHCIF